jgi:hypothetical protein
MFESLILFGGRVRKEFEDKGNKISRQHEDHWKIAFRTAGSIGSPNSR